ncbi:hypothetical protein EV426DRAFT_577591 [Tirmania nivea]|nr:hypothetical protein EV426DRAFT_577591 [Tirmania nivea]
MFSSRREPNPPSSTGPSVKYWRSRSSSRLSMSSTEWEQSWREAGAHQSPPTSSTRSPLASTFHAHDDISASQRQKQRGIIPVNIDINKIPPEGSGQLIVEPSPSPGSQIKASPSSLKFAPASPSTRSMPSSPGPPQDDLQSTLQPKVMQTPPKASLWEQVVLKLSIEEQELCKKSLEPLLQVPATGGPPEKYTSEILTKLMAAAHLKRQECVDKRWKVVIRGREIMLRAVIEKMVDFAQRFRDVGTIAVSYSSVCAALPWAAFVVLLQFAVADKELLGHILSGLETTARLLADGVFYETLYLTEGKGFASSQSLARLEGSLTDIYCSILSYLLKIISITEKSTICIDLSASISVGTQANKCQSYVVKSLKAQWYHDELLSSHAIVLKKELILKDQVGHVEIEVKKCTNEEFIQRFTGTLTYYETPDLDRNALADQEALQNELSKIVTQQLSHYDQKVDQLVEQLEDQERNNILAWLSAVEYPNHHSSAEEGRVPGTGQWLLKHETFLEWVGANGSSCLWLKGNAGAGKTMLASLIVQTLMDRLNTAPTNSEALAYFYCNRDDPQRAKPEIVMSTLVQQLASLRPGEQLQKVVVDEYKFSKRATGRPISLTLSNSNNLARALCNIYPQTWIVVDALDECDTRQTLIRGLLNLARDCTSLVKIFFTSRLDSDIAATLDSDNIFVRSIALHSEASESSGDMRNIVEAKVKEAFEESGLLKGKIDKDQIQNICVTNRRSYQSPKHILAALKEFPADLTQIYDFMLRQLLTSPEIGANPLGIAAFQWVMTAPRPLTADELLGAVAMDDDSINLDTILEVCNNLLVYDEKQKLIRLYHLSVREYLEQHWPKLFDEDKVRSTIVEKPLSLLKLSDGIRGNNVSN